MKLDHPSGRNRIWSDSRGRYLLKFKYQYGGKQCQMGSRERTNDFHSQDWIIIIDALAMWAGPPDELKDGRNERAYELIEAIAAEQGLHPAELLLQVD